MENISTPQIESQWIIKKETVICEWRVYRPLPTFPNNVWQVGRILLRALKANILQGETGSLWNKGAVKLACKIVPTGQQQC